MATAEQMPQGMEEERARRAPEERERTPLQTKREFDRLRAQLAEAREEQDMGNVERIIRQLCGYRWSARANMHSIIEPRIHDLKDRIAKQEQQLAEAARVWGDVRADRGDIGILRERIKDAEKSFAFNQQFLEGEIFEQNDLVNVWLPDSEDPSTTRPAEGYWYVAGKSKDGRYIVRDPAKEVHETGSALIVDVAILEGWNTPHPWEEAEE